MNVHQCIWTGHHAASQAPSRTMLMGFGGMLRKIAEELWLDGCATNQNRPTLKHLQNGYATVRGQGLRLFASIKGAFDFRWWCESSTTINLAWGCFCGYQVLSASGRIGRKQMTNRQFIPSFPVNRFWNASFMKESDVGWIISFEQPSFSWAFDQRLTLLTLLRLNINWV